MLFRAICLHASKAYFCKALVNNMELNSITLIGVYLIVMVLNIQVSHLLPSFFDSGWKFKPYCILDVYCSQLFEPGRLGSWLKMIIVVVIIHKLPMILIILNPYRWIHSVLNPIPPFLYALKEKSAWLGQCALKTYNGFYLPLWSLVVHRSFPCNYMSLPNQMGRLHEPRHENFYIQSNTWNLLLQSFLSTTFCSSSSNNFISFHLQPCHFWFSPQPFTLCNVNLLHPSNRSLNLCPIWPNHCKWFSLNLFSIRAIPTWRWISLFLTLSILVLKKR